MTLKECPKPFDDVHCNRMGALSDDNGDEAKRMKKSRAESFAEHGGVGSDCHDDGRAAVLETPKKKEQSVIYQQTMKYVLQKRRK